MHHQEFESPKELKEDIKCFWYNNRDADTAQADFEILPDGYAEIIFYFGSLTSISYRDGQHPLPSPFLMGLLNQPVIFHTSHRLEIIGVRCFPWTVFNLLSMPSGKGAMRVFEHPIAGLQYVLNSYVSAGRVADAVTVVKQYFLDARSLTEPNSTLKKAGIAMKEANGTMPVHEVAAAAHATVRTLERKFKQSSGYTIKDVSGLMRFEQVRNRLWVDPDSSLSSLAYELGYSDQAHLNKDFKRYSGTTPGAFARKAKKDKQASDNNFVAFVQG
jgi:AraC-like DNA-binding protein